MNKFVFGCMALSCALFFAPVAPAMQRTRPQAQKKLDQRTKPVPGKALRSNVKADANEGFVFPLDYAQIERVRIELLERRFNAGFDAGRGSEIEPQLVEAISQFQMEYAVPATGEIDSATLTALSVPMGNENPAIGQSPQRAKPSK